MPDLSSNNGEQLLKLARNVIVGRFQQETDKKTIGGMSRGFKGGCFVTLKKHGQLRGCVGTFETECSLSENIERMALLAAFEDPRFEPVAAGEIADLRIEISIIGPKKKMEHIEELVLGRHGICVQYKEKNGTFLPDVAVEQNWSREKFIRNCAVEKAGLEDDQIPLAEIYLYEVQKFSE